MNFIWTQFIALPWWGMSLWAIYTIYFVIRAWFIWHETSDCGLWKGYKNVFFDDDVIRLYHILRIVFDIPPAVLGLIFPLCRAIFTMKVYEFRKEVNK